MNFEGKRIVVAGGTSGIGFAVAAAVAKEGAQVIVASRNAERVAAPLCMNILRRCYRRAASAKPTISHRLIST
jgi:NAD(P)-dependent dehydrogenase (short-subunit alcohol dehydrogenase family)